MNRRHVLSTLGTLTFAPLLSAFDHSRIDASQHILVACFGASGESVLRDLKRFDTTGLLQPMMVETESQAQSVVEAVSNQRVVLVTRSFFPLAWATLDKIRRHPNCNLNFSTYIVYPHLSDTELKMNLTENQIPRWAYSYVDFVRLVNRAYRNRNVVRSRWQLRYSDKSLANVERQVAYEILKVRTEGQ